MNETESYQPSNKSATLTSFVLLSLASAYFLIFPQSVLRNAQSAAMDASMGLSGETHTADIPYFVESEDLQSTLVLNNNKPDETAAIVTIYNTRGEALQLPGIKLKPLMPTRFRLQ